MIKAVLFDYGGVVGGRANDFVRQGEPYDPSLEKVAQAWGTNYQTIIHYLKDFLPQLQKGLIKEKEVWEKFAEKQAAFLPEDYEKLLARDITQLYPVNKEMVDLIKKIRSCGVRTAVLSTIVQSQAEAFQQVGRYDHFDLTFLSYQMNSQKPEEEAYRYPLVALQPVLAEECIFIDDVERHLPPARSLGIKTICFRSGTDSVSALKEEMNRQGLRL